MKKSPLAIDFLYINNIIFILFNCIINFILQKGFWISFYAFLTLSQLNKECCFSFKSMQGANFNLN